jgi:YbgC/YbaW family acyl-CoA thioester hydrolase
MQKLTVTERVRWSDVDFAGIVFYGSYIRFLEIAEEELFRTALRMTSMELYDKFNIWLPRVQIHCDFRSSAELDDLLEVDIWVKRFGNKSITLQFETHKQGDSRLIFEASTTVASMDRATKKGTWMPDEIASKLSPYVQEWARPQPQ